MKKGIDANLWGTWRSYFDSNGAGGGGGEAILDGNINDGSGGERVISHGQCVSSTFIGLN